MKQFTKTRWQSDGDDLKVGFDFSKVDKQRRVVAGWATIDNVDTEGDIITAEASIDAFQRSRGNLREMHKKDSAVGRVISYKEDSFTAPDGETYRGIFVKVRVSEGAEDTWKKVLDGTLSGFSIGGHIVESEEIFQKSDGRTIRKVNKFDLNELSLVDNPGNQYSDVTNVFKLRKSADGSVTALTGMIEEQTILNVFYCSEDSIAKESPSDSYSCPICENSMTSIGFVEDSATRGEKVSTLVTKHVTSEGGATMEKTKKEGEGDESVETGHEQGDPTEVPTPARTDEDAVKEVEVEKDAEEVVEEVHDESDEIAKKIDSLKEDISSILSKNSLDTNTKIEELEKTFKETRDSLDEKLNSLEEKYGELHKNLETQKSRQTDLEESLNKMNSSVAFRKSVDSDESTVEVQKTKTTWNGAFSVNDLLK